MLPPVSQQHQRVKEIALETIAMRATIQIPMSNVEVRSHKVPLSIAPDVIAWELAAKFLGSTEEQTYKVPRGWFQHFKESCFPKYLKKKFPIKYKVLTFTAHEAFPELDTTRRGVRFYEKIKETGE